MKWFTLNSSATLDSGESLSEYEAWVQGRKVVSLAADHGTIAPELSLHFRVTGRPYNEGVDALEANAADQINCKKLALVILFVP
jgi:hypothetical protein